jgi:trimethylamine--corrinoid protein Co-methyltransferase
MQKDYLYPQIANRASPNQWVEQGKPTLIETASKKLKAILDHHYPSHISPEMDAQIRANFPVRLAREGMLAK